MTASDFIALGALVVSAGSYFYTILGVNESRRATQLQVFDSIFKAINALENEFVTLRDKGETPSARWSYEFFNTLEYMAFVLNHKLIKSDDFVGFYENSVRSWYKTFSSTTDRKHLDDPEFYPEFKKLYRKVKSDGIVPARDAST